MRWGRSAFARISAAAFLAFPALLAVSGILVAESRAEGLSGFLELDYSQLNTDATAADGRTVNTKSGSFTQLYNLTFDRNFYPNLKFLASGNFLNTDTSFESQGVKTESTRTIRRPYLSLNLRTPLYYAEVAGTRNEEKVRTAGNSLTTERDSLVSTLYWRPDRFPDLKLQYLWDHLYDKNRLNVDTVSNNFQLTSNYQPAENMRLYYQGTFRNTDLRLTDTTSKETIHNGRVYYSNNWWSQRVTFGMEYNITNQEIETTTTGAGEVVFRVFPFEGLSVLSDTPGNIVLTSNPALIDGSLTAGSGINLGLPAPGENNQLRNMGLDFLVPTEINTLYVYVDRDVAQVADAFTWRIYTSADNQNWDLRQNVSPAIYSLTFNRFEIRFTNVNARYVKVVTAPLSPAVPFAPSYPVILVTELQAEVRKPASEVAGKLTSTLQRGSVDLRAVILEAYRLTYEFSYIFNKNDPGELSYTVSNGLSFFQQFNRVFSGTGRVAFENGEQQDGYRETFLYTASLTAVPFQTLYHSLLFSGQTQTVAGEKETNFSIMLYNNAKFYEGIDANLWGGVSLKEDSTGLKNRNTQLNAGVTFVPNKNVNLTLLYYGTTTSASGGNVQGEITTFQRAGEASLAITPLQRVYLFGSYRIDTSTEFDRVDTLNYSVNWSPFPDGTVHLNFSFNETSRSDDSMDRSIIPSVRWYITPRSYVDFTYQNLKTENPAFTTLSNVYSGTVRITF